MSQNARTIVSTKGQVILPKAIRDHQQWTAGTRLIVEETANGVLLRSAKPFPPTKPAELLNACTDATCAPFPNTVERLPLIGPDGKLPPLP